MIDANSIDPMAKNVGQAADDEIKAGAIPEDDDIIEDEVGDVIEPLAGLPHDDYGIQFEAPAPAAPMDVALRLDRLFRTDGGRTLISWRGSWMRWSATHWYEIDFAQLRSHVYRSLSRATFEHKGKTQRWNPSKNKVANVLEAMNALGHFPSDINPPAWIGEGGTETEASQMLSCANGLLDLSQRTLLDHTPALFNFVSVPFDYDPAAAQPAAWLEFLASLWPDDPDSIMLLQEYFGYVLSGRTDMHKMLVLIGPIRGGKGTIARILIALIGKGNVAGPTLANLGTNFGLSPLLGKPLAIISDARLGSAPTHTVVERLLSITGEDTLDVDRKFRELYTGRLQTRFMILSNELPRFNDSSGAIATRMLILQLTESFLNREDRTIEERLVRELPGILNWSIAGLDRLTANGRFTVPASADAAATMMMDLASPVSAFVRECCERGPDLTVERDVLYLAWKLWAETNGHLPGAKITFGRSVHAAVPGLGRADIPVGGRRVHGYRGIALLGENHYRGNNPDRPAQPAQQAESAGQGRFGSNRGPAQRATAYPETSKRPLVAQNGAHLDAGHNRRSTDFAQDARDQTQCRSGNNHEGRPAGVPPTRQREPQHTTQDSGTRDREALRTIVELDPPALQAAPATTSAAIGKPTTATRINGRPLDRSAHYKASGKGGKGRRKR